MPAAAPLAGVLLLGVGASAGLVRGGFLRGGYRRQGAAMKPALAFSPLH